METLSTAGDSVARIAYLASDYIVSVQPSLAAQSEFTPQLSALAKSKTPSLISGQVPEIEVVRQNADPLLSAHEPIGAGKLVSITTTSAVLLQAIPHLYKLAQHPVVISVSLESINDFADYSDITAVRQCGFTFIQSESLRESQDLAICAHALARKSGKGVIHFFESEKLAKDVSIELEDRQLIKHMLGMKSGHFDISNKTDSNGHLHVDGTHNTEATELDSASMSEVMNKPEKQPESTSATPDANTPASRKTLNSEDIYNIIEEIWAAFEKSTGRKYRPFDYTGPSTAKAALFTFGADAALLGEEMGAAEPTDQYADCGLITVRMYRPWLGSVLSKYLPKSLERVAVLEQIRRKTTKWGPLLLDFLASVNNAPGAGVLIVGYHLGYLEPSTIRQALNGVFSNLLSASPIQNLEVGKPAESRVAFQRQALEQPLLENAYYKILNQVFGDRLYVANRLGSTDAGVSPHMEASPEFGFGSLLARMERKRKFMEDVREAAQTGEFTTSTPADWLSRWLLSAEDPIRAGPLAEDVIDRLSTDGSPIASQLLESKSLFFKESQWLVGSDAWAFDLGNSGVHHVLASGQNVNMLVIDSQPYTERAAADATRRKKDIGLYAMNFGNAYVASVAVYGSYTQVLEAMIEADRFPGPSVVLAYLPYHKETDSAVSVLQETKKAVDIGYWPLYRWRPAGDDLTEPDFQLDSERLKKELEDFLRRDNHLTMLMKKQPEFSSNLAGSYGSEIREIQKRKAKDAYSKLLDGLYGASVAILFASDNGNAESLAKRLGNRGKARGLRTMVMSMDDYPMEDLPKEENVVLITSTAGQGEFPQNGRAFWEAVKTSTDLDLTAVNFAVFGLGDSHYWPRKEDKHYYNKSGKDLHARILSLGGKALTDIGLGDDQDPDEYQTGYNDWEPKLWQALGVAGVEGVPEEPPPITNEDIKINSNFLRGTIAEGLADQSTGAIAATDQQLTKFHGTYMQDDRDLRDERKAQGLEPAFQFMIRCRVPGGVATASQWLQMDAISTDLGNETIKLTTRQTFQFHGVVKGKLRPAMQAINRALMTTLAACGDVNRNVMCSSLPQHSKYHAEVHAVAKTISDYLLPSTTAYHEIWLQDPETNTKTQIAGDAVVDSEPLYGATYLPRKFKIAIAVPPHNDIDVYTNDVGLIAIQAPDGSLQGFNVLAGGGMGVTHGNKKTYPRTGSMLGYCTPDQVHLVCRHIMLVQRDHGDRKNRKHARLKYTMDDMGVDVFRTEVESAWGQTFDAAKPFRFESNIDTFGWQRDERGMHHFTMFIENGRVEDTSEWAMKTGLREIARVHKGAFRLTGNQHLILSDVADEDLATIKDLLAKYKLDNTAHSALRLSSSACVAFPTCGLAMAESERYLPELVTKLEGALEAAGLRQDSIVLRMTGCPNGCARPWVAEIALVGKAYGAYNLYLGGGYHGQRLNKLYRSSIGEEEILGILKPMIADYAVQRVKGERFGDFVIRKGIIKETTEGKHFHEDIAEAEDDE